MTKHTPGPWVVRHPQQHGGNADHLIMGANDQLIAVIPDYGPPEEVEANANAAAAVPEMLAALKECLNAEMKRREKLLPNAPATTYCEARIAKIRAAIAKAEGIAP